MVVCGTCVCVVVSVKVSSVWLVCGCERVNVWVPGCECECALHVSVCVHEDERSAGLWLGLLGSVEMCEMRVSPHVRTK